MPGVHGHSAAPLPPFSSASAINYTGRTGRADTAIGKWTSWISCHSTGNRMCSSIFPKSDSIFLMQTLTQASSESRILIKSLETQILGVKSEFDLAHRSNTSKFREIESSQAEDHKILKESGDLLQQIVKQVRSGWTTARTLYLISLPPVRLLTYHGFICIR